MNNQSHISPLAPKYFPKLPEISGVRLATAACGIKQTQSADVLLAEFDSRTTIAGVLTCSKTASAPVIWCRRNLPNGLAQALLVNSGNANAFTGVKGMEAVDETVAAVAHRLTCRPSRVFTASTGVIGEPLPVKSITSMMNKIVENLNGTKDPEVWEAAASAIMTIWTC